MSPSRNSKRRSMPVIATYSQKKIDFKQHVNLAPESPSCRKLSKRKSMSMVVAEASPKPPIKKDEFAVVPETQSMTSRRASLSKSRPYSSTIFAPQQSQLNSTSLSTQKRKSTQLIATFDSPSRSSSRNQVTFAPESPLDSISIRRSSAVDLSKTLVIEELKSQSQATTVDDGTSPPFNPRAFYLPMDRSQKLTGRLGTLFEIQSRRSQATKKIKVDPKRVTFICGVNRFSDSNYEYMIRVNDGEVDLSAFLAPVRLNVHIDVRPMTSFKQPVIIGEATVASTRNSDNQ